MRAGRPIRVLVVAEYYPTAADPVLGVWAHRQTVEAARSGFNVRVLLLKRPVPPERALKALLAGRPDVKPVLGWMKGIDGAFKSESADGIRVDKVPLWAPPMRWSYGAWGAWAGPAVRRAVRRVASEWPFDLIHAHYAIPAGQAALAARAGVPVVISVHGFDVLTAAHRSGYSRLAVGRSLAEADLVLCNSRYMEERAEKLGRGPIKTRIVHLGADAPGGASPPKRSRPTVVTVGHLVKRKHHADVIRAIAPLGGVDYLVIGDGPERRALEHLAENLGVADRVEFTGQLDNDEALDQAARCHVFAMPSTDEAFGVAYIEAMARGLPAIGLTGEGGPEEIARLGAGMIRVPANRPDLISDRISELKRDADGLENLGRSAAETVRENFTWRRCGEATADAYRAVLESRP